MPHSLAKEPATKKACLHAEAEVDAVAVMHHVLLAFQTQGSFFAGRVPTTEFFQFLKSDSLRTDEAARDVAVNLRGGNHRRVAALDRPGAHLVLADREKRLQSRSEERRVGK